MKNKAIQINELLPTKERFTLEGKVVIVTGSAGGIGRSAAANIADMGADVALVDIRGDILQKNAEFIAEKYGVKTKAYAVDLSKEDQIEALIENVAKDFGKIDCIFSNAGIFSGKDDAIMPLADWQKMIDLNLTGMFLINRTICEYWVKNGIKGVIVNTASMSGSAINRVPEESHHSVAYPASKAGAKHLTKAMAMKYCSAGIRINSVSPGYMLSGVHDQLPDELVEAVAADVPMKRFGTMDEIGGMVAFLMTDLASYITGADFLVDGGYTVW